MNIDKKEIMTNAWKIMRKGKGKISFSEALKMSWKLEKAILKMKKKDGIESGFVSVNFWFCYGKYRAYVQRSWVSNYQNKCSYYIDLVDGSIRL